MYITLTDLKAYLSISNTTDDVVLTGMIAAAQAGIDAYTMRTFEAAADSIRYLDAADDVDGALLWLPDDLAQITTITNGDATTVTTADYVTQPRNRTPYYALKLKADSDITWTYDSTPENAISILGRWANCITPPPHVVQATRRWAAYLYRQRDANVFDVTAQPDIGIITVPQGIPADVEKLLAPYRRLAF
jgi:hypothetical protein